MFDKMLIIFLIAGVFLLLNAMARAFFTKRYELSEIGPKLDCEITNQGVLIENSGQLDEQDNVEVATIVTSDGPFAIAQSRSKYLNDAIKIADGTYEWRYTFPINNLGKTARIYIREHVSEVHLSVKASSTDSFNINVLCTYKPYLWGIIGLSVMLLTIIGVIVTFAV
jgi:hypothetical protein